MLMQQGSFQNTDNKIEHFIPFHHLQTKAVVIRRAMISSDVQQARLYTQINNPPCQLHTSKKKKDFHS